MPANPIRTLTPHHVRPLYAQAYLLFIEKEKDAHQLAADTALAMAVKDAPTEIKAEMIRACPAVKGFRYKAGDYRGDKEDAPARIANYTPVTQEGFVITIPEEKLTKNNIPSLRWLHARKKHLHNVGELCGMSGTTHATTFANWLITYRGRDQSETVPESVIKKYVAAKLCPC